MNSKEIENLKFAFTNIAMKGFNIQSDDYKVHGKIVGVGFKPYWSNQHDSKIDKLEINVLDRNGMLVPFNFYHVVGYELISYDGDNPFNSKNLCLDIHVYSPSKNVSEPYDKVRLNIFSDE